MTDLMISLGILGAVVACFLAATRLGERRCLAGGLLGYLVPALLVVTALTVAAVAHSGEIWQTEQGVYTDMPERYSGEAKPWKPSRDRWTPVRAKPSFSRSMRNVTAMAGMRFVQGAEYCTGVFLGNSLAMGGAAICRGEQATIRRERVRERDSITTTTDTVLLVGGREVMRIEGPRYNHRPRAVRRH